jgi:hypothetical protein
MRQDPPMPSRTRSILRIAAAVVCAASPVQASPPDDLFEWVTVGDPGNAPAPGHDPGIGTVDRPIRITKTLVTATHWIDFIHAYLPYYTGYPDDFAFITDMVFVNFSDPTRPDGLPNYYLPDVYARRPARVSLEYAARYVNWLHNGMVDEAWAFETGVYDTSTFWFDDENYAQHDLTPAPGARYWIPDISEMLKAAYYDPEKNSGAGGWWLYPDGGDEPLTIGLPGEGGQTIGDLIEPLEWDLGQYPETVSPFGLIDVSGSTYQMTSTQHGLRNNTVRVVGSYAGASYISTVLDDHLHKSFTYSFPLFNSFFAGFRIATASCPADLAAPYAVLDITDLVAYLDLFSASTSGADLTSPYGVVNFFDLAAYLDMYNAGCL